jgi:MSHA biogenesis protein MshI
LFAAKAKKTSLTTSGISFLDDGIAFALVSHEQDTPAILHCEFIACSNSEYESILNKLSKEHSLDIHQCNVVLQPNQYQIVPVEKPDVAAEELSLALKWRVKDVIDFHIDDTVLEVLTPSGNTSNSNMVEVVATKSSIIQRIVDLLRSTDINLTSIDIAELASRNIGFNLQPELSSYALLNLWENDSRISVYLNNDLYLSRISSIGINTLKHVSEDDISSVSILDTLALELQRTYDYYESHSRQAPIADLFLLHNQSTGTEINELIQQRTGVNTQVLDISPLISNKSISVEPKCMSALGAALRNEFD